MLLFCKTFAAIYHNSNKSLITFVLLRVISTVHVINFCNLQFVQIAAKRLIDFVLFYQIAQTHLEMLPFIKYQQIAHHQYLCYFMK